MGETLRAVPLVAGTAILWGYIFTPYGYKVWYAGAAAVVLLVLCVALSGRIETNGVVRATLPIVVYFAVFAIGASWAEHPAHALRWLAVDAIGIGIFAVFYLAGRNSTDTAIAGAIVTVVIPAVLLTALELRLDPPIARTGGYSPMLLPLVIAFASWSAALSRRKALFLLAMSATIALLLIGRGRAPLAAALIALGLSAIAYGTSASDRIRRGAAALAGVMAIALLLSVIPATRPMMLTTLIRITRMLPGNDASAAIAKLEKELSATAYWVQIRPREQVSIRTQISALTPRLARESFPHGIGYRNFQMYFERTYGFQASLHSMYMAWLIEGGVPIVVLVLMYAYRWVDGLRARRSRFAAAVFIALAATSFLGAFHQVHQAPALWLLLGLGAAVSTRSRPRDFAR
ncbi:MAG TPA: hypothetical protein VEK79_22915 [Thermoanaerobaculia bacterium]|nr:hypothetical protein [Thermoanaerobaculia bacterium]